MLADQNNPRGFEFFFASNCFCFMAAGLVNENHLLACFTCHPALLYCIITLYPQMLIASHSLCRALYLV